MRILTTLLIVLFSLSLHAQRGSSAVAEKLTEKLSASLKLDAEQKRKVQKANEDLIAGMQTLFGNEDDRRGRVQEVRKLRDSHQQALESILNAEQKKQYAVLKEEQKQKVMEAVAERLGENATEKMQERLKLTAVQTKSVDSINAESFKTILSGLMDDDNRGMQRMRAARKGTEERDAAMKAVLTEAQYTEYQKMTDEQRKKMRERLQQMRDRN